MKRLTKIIMSLIVVLYVPSICLAMEPGQEGEEAPRGPAVRECPHCRDLRQDCLVLKRHGKGASGKWLDNVTPKRGWVCQRAEDVGSGDLEQCEMCEREQVRYVHLMHHGNENPLDLRVGCICAGYMDGSLDTADAVQRAVKAAQKRTRVLTNRTARRSKFPELVSWRISKNGNPCIQKDGNHVIITSGRGRYSAMINRTPLRAWFDSVKEAKLAAFDHLYPPQTR